MTRNTIILTILIIFLLAYLIFGDYGLLRYFRLVQIKHNYEMQIEEMDKKIEELEKELRFLKKDRMYLESLIRKELNLKKPDEDLFIIKRDNSTKK